MLLQQTAPILRITAKLVTNKCRDRPTTRESFIWRRILLIDSTEVVSALHSSGKRDKSGEFFSLYTCSNQAQER